MINAGQRLAQAFEIKNWRPRIRAKTPEIPESIPTPHLPPGEIPSIVQPDPDVPPWNGPEYPNFVGLSRVEACGKRRNARARVRVYLEGQGIFLVNGLDVNETFTNAEDLDRLLRPLNQSPYSGKVNISIQVTASSTHSQIDAARQGLVRALARLSANDK